jgi:hypothetical protein
MLLADRLRDLVDAAFTGVWIRSDEPDEALAEIRQLSAQEGYRLIVAEPLPGFDPYAPFLELKGLEGDDAGLLVLPNYHAFLADPFAKQAMYRAIMEGKTARRFVIVVSPKIEIPVELDKVLVVVDHELPNRQDLEAIARNLATNPGEMPEGPELSTLLDAAAGLTRYEAEGAFSLSIVQHQKIDAATVWAHKEGSLKKSGLLTLYRGDETFDGIGGLGPIKDYLTASLDPAAPFSGHGVMLVGVPGSGKSTLAKALASKTGRPCLIMDIGSMVTKWVGEAGQNIRRALAIADAMSPCILFLDEIEKALAGHASDSSGTQGGILGALLTWLQDHKTPVYVIGTSNKLKDLPSALTRSGRIDATWFLDFPDAKQREMIWPIWLKAYKLDPDQPRPPDDRWTGAEIRHCCFEAAQKRRPVVETARFVIPVSVSGAKENEELRSDAAGKYLDANTGEIFSLRPAATATTERRRVTRRNDLE